MNLKHFNKKIETENLKYNYNKLSPEDREQVIKIDYETELLKNMHSKCLMYSIKVFFSINLILFKQYTAIGVLIGTPISIYKRSYWPFITTGVIGSACDYYDSKIRCRPYEQMLDLLYEKKDKILGVNVKIPIIEKTENI